MKKIFILLSFLLILISCNDSDDDSAIMETDALGSWKIVAVYYDPGDGSGDFEPANNKTIEFTDLGTVSSNIGICFGDPTATATYDSINQSITTANCSINYTFNGRFLEISQPCIESCIERFIRIN